MHPKSLFRRRPSASMVVALVALFASLGGVGYAAVSLPSNSVGTSQIQNEAVTYKKIQPGSVGVVRLTNGGVVNSKLANNSVSFQKIQPGAVGHVRADLDQIQARIGPACPSGTAISAVDRNGKPTCSQSSPAEFGATSNGQVTVASGNTNTTIASESLPANSSYLLFGTANAVVTDTTGADNSKWVEVTCTVNPGGTSASRSADATVHIDNDNPVSVNIPIVLPISSAATASTASLTCTFANATGASPTVKATGSLNAIATSNNS